MCRNIKTLFNFEPPATEVEVRAASLQFVRKLSGFKQLAFFDQLEPVGNVVVHRALPFTIGIAAGQASSSLCRRIGTVVVPVYFAEVLNSLLDVLLIRFLSRHFQKLQRMFEH